jgi:hypothetical protein
MIETGEVVAAADAMRAKREELIAQPLAMVWVQIARAGIEAAEHYREFIKREDAQIFVFGSNLAGRHGKGAALVARQKHGAIYGQGAGRQGGSYAIPTKDAKLRTLPLVTIKVYVDHFIAYAKDHPNLIFNLTAIGCGLAGYKPVDISPMFQNAPSNVVRPPEFKLLEHT